VIIRKKSSREIQKIQSNAPLYPPVLYEYLGEDVPSVVTAIGDMGLLNTKLIGFFCSVKCPGKLIIQVHDLAHELKQAGATVISGFHSPVEQECLRILLRGTQSVIICPARSMEKMRIRAEYRQPLDQGRLLFLSPFLDKPHRITAQSALRRNYFVAALANQIFVAHSEPSGKTNQFCRNILQWRKPVFTLPNEANELILAIGAKPVSPDCRGDLD
jgi:predicted Rossmann fold nucleotide-binding protein DprA/Smf involved in DNA uptake